MKRDASEQNDLIGGPACIDYILSVLGRVDGGKNCTNCEPFPGFVHFFKWYEHNNSETILEVL